MGHAGAALELLLQKDAATATRLAAELERTNTERRAATESAQSAAEAALAGHTDEPILVFSASGLSVGVIGLVAGRLARQYYRPAAVVRIDGDLARGSARSIPEFDVVAALEDEQDLLVRFGGHAQAAGFTVETRRLDELVSRLRKSAATALRDVDLRPTLHIDAVIRPDELGWGLHDALAQLEPFGEGNRRPRLLLHDARISAKRLVGSEHVRFVVETGGEAGSMDAIAFNAGDRLRVMGDRVDLVCSLRLNKWRGRRNLELLIDDMAAPA
jgi:single-stranded-DNA-specific exonuclease